jgi:hypothetical protein
MKTNIINIAAGSVFSFSEGEYSDFAIAGHFIALETITNETMQAAIELAKSTSKDWNKHKAAEQFISALIKSGKVIVINVQDIHMGGYGFKIEGLDAGFTEGD